MTSITKPLFIMLCSALALGLLGYRHALCQNTTEICQIYELFGCRLRFGF